MRQGNGDAGFAVHANGTVADAIAAVLKREGVDVVFGYPRNQILEAAGHSTRGAAAAERRRHDLVGGGPRQHGLSRRHAMLVQRPERLRPVHRIEGGLRLGA